MAKKQDASEELQTQDVTDMMSIPDYVEQKQVGTQHIDDDDVRVPRLLLAQALSPQVTKGDPSFIEGLSAGDSFNDLTLQNYGDGPLDIMVIRADRRRWVEFDEDRNVLDPDVQDGSEKTKWTVLDGERVPPAADMFYDYVFGIIHPSGSIEPVAVSFKRSGIKQAQRLNGLLRMHKVGIWAKHYRATPTHFKNDQGAWSNFVVTQHGFWDRETYEKGKALFEQFAEVEVKYDVTPDAGASDEVDDSMAANAEV